MKKDLTFLPFRPGELIIHDDGTATYDDYTYTRIRSALNRRAKDVCTHTKEQWLELASKYHFRCCKCDCEVIGGVPTKDHILPTRFGGTDSIENIQPLCRQCNVGKGLWNIIDYRGSNNGERSSISVLSG